MSERKIDVEIDDETNKIIVVLDVDSYKALEKRAETAGMTVEAFAKKVIEDGMKEELGKGDL